MKISMDIARGDDFVWWGNAMPFLQDNEELIDRGEDFSTSHLRASRVLSFPEALFAAGVHGNSPALRHLLDRIQEMENCDRPIVFTGSGGVGKATFARLLHRLHSHDSSSCLSLDCRELPSGTAQFRTALANYLIPLKNAQRPSAIFTHLEALPPVRREYVLAQLPWPIFPMGTVTTDGLDIGKLWRGTCSIAVPDIHGRRSDLQPTILAKLREMNHTSGLQKRIAAATLELLKFREYPNNFRSLHRLLEKLHAIHPDVIAIDGDIPNCPDSADLLPPTIGMANFHLNDFLRTLRRKIVNNALKMASNNQVRAAQLLGITPQAISKFLRGQRVNPTPRDT
jgi:DNA-binding NtrC family response regulator